MTAQGPRIFTVNPQSFGAGRSALLQASPFKRFLIVCLLILVAIPLLALGRVILLVIFTIGLFKALFHSGGRVPGQSAGPSQPGPMRGGQAFPTASRKEDSMRENVKVIKR